MAGGGQTTNAIHTDAQQAEAWEKFRIWVERATVSHPVHTVTYAIQTFAGNFLTAVDGGNLAGSDVLHTDATHAQAWERFRLAPIVPPASAYVGLETYSAYPIPPWYYAIQTERGDFLSAVGGGGRSEEPTMQSDSQQIRIFELFHLASHGEVLSGYTYGFLEAVHGGWMWAVNGGDKAKYGLAVQKFSDDPDGATRYFAKFRILRQPDGTYALQTLSGNYVTAVSGGGVAPLAGYQTDAFHTTASVVEDWEKFNILDQGDGTYVIQTKSGYYVGVFDLEILRTDSRDLADAARFALTPYLTD